MKRLYWILLIIVVPLMAKADMIHVFDPDEKLTLKIIFEDELIKVDSVTPSIYIFGHEVTFKTDTAYPGKSETFDFSQIDQTTFRFSPSHLSLPDSLRINIWSKGKEISSPWISVRKGGHKQYLHIYYNQIILTSYPEKFSGSNG